MNQTIVVLYEEMTTARQALQTLRDEGVPMSAVSLVARDSEDQYAEAFEPNGEVVEELDAAASGVAVGAMVGGVGGLLAGIGALFIPGIGPVLAAGPIAAALSGLAGAGAGAVAGSFTGGLIGALVDTGVPREQAQYYGEAVRRGGALITATVPDEYAAHARDVLDRYGPIDIRARADEWRRGGWTSYDVEARPLTTEEILEERERYRVR